MEGIICDLCEEDLDYCTCNRCDLCEELFLADDLNVGQEGDDLEELCITCFTKKYGHFFK